MNGKTELQTKSLQTRDEYNPIIETMTKMKNRLNIKRTHYTKFEINKKKM